MTQLQMTEQQLNRALTEIQGYSVRKTGEHPDRYRMVNPNGQEFGIFQLTEGLVWNEYAFPYCSDPSASLEVQAKAIEVDADEYVGNLNSVMCEDMSNDAYWTNEDIAILLQATPRQRSEAAYLTIKDQP
ncbi:hypothetical protein PMSD_09980 [Paenibacillus macquariensis subsp. defensor]|nr:hypothetical protein PMSD_09980 [Paenibacillus macquariensis subsp. defensor]